MNNHPRKPSVSLATSVTSILWSVWWATLVRDILDSPITDVNLIILHVQKVVILIGLAAWATVFAIVFVRWLTRVETWDLSLDIGRLGRNSRSLLVYDAWLLGILFAIQQWFSLKGDLMIYGFAVSIAWPLVPFLVAVLPEGER